MPNIIVSRWTGGQHRLTIFDSVHQAMRHCIDLEHADRCAKAQILLADSIAECATGDVIFDHDAVRAALRAFEGAHLRRWQRDPGCMRSWQKICERIREIQHGL
jgi:hypothetical protein